MAYMFILFIITGSSEPSLSKMADFDIDLNNIGMYIMYTRIIDFLSD
jgi:hypothetical protein